jgi:ADP-ribose pyrophosphatase
MEYVDENSVIKRPEPRQKMPDDAKLVHDGIVYKAYRWEQELFDGSTTTFEKLSRTDSSGVIAIKDGKIILTEQSQPAMEPFIGIIGGKIDDGETPLEAAKRELLEEAGLVSENWILWEAAQLSESIDRAIYIFIAKDCTETQKPKPDAGEKIELVEFNFEEFIKVVKQPNFRDTEIILSITRAEALPGELEKIKKAMLG